MKSSAQVQRLHAARPRWRLRHDFWFCWRAREMPHPCPCWRAWKMPDAWPCWRVWEIHEKALAASLSDACGKVLAVILL